jgi:hypothetical protein
MDRTGSNPQFRNAGVFWLASTTALFGSSGITDTSAVAWGSSFVDGDLRSGEDMWRAAS